MLSSLIAAALLASSAAAGVAVAKPDTKNKLTKEAFAAKIQADHNAKFLKKFEENKVAAPAGLKFKAAADTSYLQTWAQDESTFTNCADSDPDYYSYQQLGSCIDISGYGYWYGATEVDGGYWNVTTTMWFNSASCAGDATYVYQSLEPGSCDDATNDGSGYRNYVMGTDSSYSANNFGSQTYNSMDNCDAGDEVISAMEMFFGTCYYMGYYYATIDSCTKSTYYIDSDCKTKVEFDDDLIVVDDSADDDYDPYACYSNGDNTYSQNYCDSSSASSYATPSVFAMIAATAAAVVAMM